jgi:hypothetical protein
VTAFVNDEGEYLDYSGSDIGTTKQCANFYDFKIKGDVTATLKIPNNSRNRKALGYYGPQQIDSPAFSRAPFNMVKDGNTISRGYVVIKDADRDFINIFYVSGNTNWFQNFQFNLKEVDYPDKYTVLMSDIDGRKAATEGIIFPLVDWWAGASKNSIEYLRYGFGNPEEFPLLTELHPCIYLSTLVDQVGRYGGVTIGGDLIEDALFKKIILTNDGPHYFVPDKTIDRSYTKFQNGPFGSAALGLYTYTLDPQPIRFNTVVEGVGSLDTTNYTWQAPFTGTYEVILDVWVNNADTYAITYDVDGVQQTAVTLSVTNNFKVPAKFLNMRKGQKLSFTVNNTAAANYRMDNLPEKTNVTVRLAKKVSGLGLMGGLVSAPYIPFAALAPDMLAIDLIKYLANYFSCVVSYDEYSNSIKINKIASFKKEDAYNWSEYYVGHREKWETKVASNNYIQTEEGTELEIESYNAQSLVRYGGGNIQTPFDALESREIYTIPFSGSWDRVSRTPAKIFLPFIRFYELDFQESVAYSGVSSASGRALFTSSFNEAIDASDVFFVESTSGIYQGYAALYSSSVTSNPVLMVDYVSGDTGTLYRYKLSPVFGPPRMMICQAGQPVSTVGGVSIETIGVSNVVVSTLTTSSALAWFDKPVNSLPIDSYNEALSVDPINPESIGISERFYGPIKKALSNPLIEAYFTLPLSVFQRFEFDRYIYLETPDLTGYFLIQKIENYRDALTPVKCELLYTD